MALAPAGEHLLRAVSEVVAAGLAALEALPEETRRRSRWTFGSARAALDVVSRLALAGADRARKQARATLKAETAREILAALDARAGRLDGRAGEALRTVRGAVAGALGLPAPSRREEPPAPSPSRSSSRSVRPSRAARTSGRLRRIPKVSFSDSEEE